MLMPKAAISVVILFIRCVVVNYSMLYRWLILGVNGVTSKLACALCRASTYANINNPCVRLLFAIVKKQLLCL